MEILNSLETPAVSWHDLVQWRNRPLALSSPGISNSMRRSGHWRYQGRWEKSRQENHGQSWWINWFCTMGWGASTCKEPMAKVKVCYTQSQPALDDFRRNDEGEPGKSQRGNSKATRGIHNKLQRAKAVPRRGRPLGHLLWQLWLSIQWPDQGE